MSLQEHLTSLREGVREITAERLRDSLTSVRIVDVRESSEVESGLIPSAIHIPRGVLETSIAQSLPDLDQEIVLYCAGGVRSLLAADSLKRIGYRSVVSLAGGIKAWKDAGLALVSPVRADKLDAARYASQLRLAEVGEEGQQRIRASRVLVVGAGGLGSPLAYYLAAAGVGTLGLVDDDRVELSNLQRQILHTTDRVGMRKVDSARLTLQSLNPRIDVQTYPVRLSSTNVDELVSAYDIVVDGTDNFQTRYLVNDACIKHRKVNVHGSVFWFQGQVTTFVPGEGGCYRCLYPEAPPGDLSMSCAEGGVLGVLPGLVGVLQATEVLKQILGIGSGLVGRLLLVDALTMEFDTVALERDAACPYCGLSQDVEYREQPSTCSQVRTP